MARKRSKGFSLGMGQRLGIAGALLGDPAILMFDEPVNGLDPEGILWIRNLMKALAAEGRTIFVSSHLMSEMENTADHLLVIGRGRLIADCSVAGIHRAQLRSSRSGSGPRSPSCWPSLIAAAGGTVHGPAAGLMVVQGLGGQDRIGDLAFENSIRLHRTGTRAGLPGGGVHGTDRGQRGVPGPHPRASTGQQTERTRRGWPEMTTTARWPAARRAACCPARPAGPASRRAAVRVHQDPVHPVHLLDPVRPDRGLHRHRRAGLRGTASPTNGHQPARFDATQQSLAGLYVGQLVIAALGALTITSEYSTGMIRTSLAVQPRRGSCSPPRPWCSRWSR